MAKSKYYLENDINFKASVKKVRNFCNTQCSYKLGTWHYHCGGPCKCEELAHYPDRGFSTRKLATKFMKAKNKNRTIRNRVIQSLKNISGQSLRIEHDLDISKLSKLQYFRIINSLKNYNYVSSAKAIDTLLKTKIENF
jgi:hypothetical protein